LARRMEFASAPRKRLGWAYSPSMVSRAKTKHWSARAAVVGDVVSAWQRPGRCGTVIGLETARYLLLIRWPGGKTDWRPVAAVDRVAPTGRFTESPDCLETRLLLRVPRRVGQEPWAYFPVISTTTSVVLST
jgi:hypothetical protein